MSHSSAVVGARSLGVALLALVLAATAACTSSNLEGRHQTDARTVPGGKDSVRTAVPDGRGVLTEAVEVTGTGSLLVAGRLPHGRKTQVWRCPSLTDISECQSVGPVGLSRSEYADDIATFGRDTYWVLTMDVDRQRSSVHTTTDGGRSWVRHAAPSRGLAAGSQGSIQALGEDQALLTEYTANGPLLQQYRTDDAGASWHPVGAVAHAVRVVVPSHCGVRSVWVHDRLWLAAPALGGHNPPPGWDENETAGAFMITGRGKAVFHTDSGLSARFRLAERGTADPSDSCE